ncbi:MAG: hypothetical protein M3Q27_04530 [Actinomycetota bacterium]|nr:hypothetical protein [Actinomycetota bacterium]
MRLTLQATFRNYVGDRPVFVLNAFSLGAWATGLNVSTSLADVCTIKSTGPDITKILETMESFVASTATSSWDIRRSSRTSPTTRAPDFPSTTSSRASAARG